MTYIRRALGMVAGRRQHRQSSQCRAHYRAHSGMNPFPSSAVDRRSAMLLEDAKNNYLRFGGCGPSCD